MVYPLLHRGLTALCGFGGSFQTIRPRAARLGPRRLEATSDSFPCPLAATLGCQQLVGRSLTRQLQMILGAAGLLWEPFQGHPGDVGGCP